MCRNIRVLHNFEPPTTIEEMHDAALQFVRKVSGMTKPRDVDREAFERAVAEVAETTRRLLETLPPRGATRTREGEREKARDRWSKRKISA